MAQQYELQYATALIDARASETPDRVYAVQPISPYDLSDGYREVSYKQLARAVNRAAWWLDEIMAPSAEKGGLELGANKVPTFTYLGPNDIRWAFLSFAAFKTKRQVRIPVGSGLPDSMPTSSFENARVENV